MLKADFHLHTNYSKDSKMTLEEVIARCQKMGINCIAVTDHGTAEGALKMKEIAPFKVIVGEEILTHNGEIIGLFLKESIKSHISVEEAIAQIRAQGGLILIPHPFDPLRGLRMDKDRLASLLQQADVIEVYNARGPFSRPITKAMNAAKQYNLAMSAGSDSHNPFEIGYTWVEIPDFKGKEDFLQALRQGVIHRQKASIKLYFKAGWARLMRKLNPPKKKKRNAASKKN